MSLKSKIRLSNADLLRSIGTVHLPSGFYFNDIFGIGALGHGLPPRVSGSDDSSAEQVSKSQKGTKDSKKPSKTASKSKPSKAKKQKKQEDDDDDDDDPDQEHDPLKDRDDDDENEDAEGAGLDDGISESTKPPKKRPASARSASKRPAARRCRKNGDLGGDDQKEDWVTICTH